MRKILGSIVLATTITLNTGVFTYATSNDSNISDKTTKIIDVSKLKTVDEKEIKELQDKIDEKDNEIKSYAYTFNFKLAQDLDMNMGVVQDTKSKASVVRTKVRDTDLFNYKEIIELTGVFKGESVNLKVYINEDKRLEVDKGEFKEFKNTLPDQYSFYIDFLRTSFTDFKPYEDGEDIIFYGEAEEGQLLDLAIKHLLEINIEKGVKARVELAYRFEKETGLLKNFKDVYYINGFKVSGSEIIFEKYDEDIKLDFPKETGF